MADGGPEARGPCHAAAGGQACPRAPALPGCIPPVPAVRRPHSPQRGVRHGRPGRRAAI